MLESFDWELKIRYGDWVLSRLTPPNVFLTPIKIMPLPGNGSFGGIDGFGVGGIDF